MTRVKRPSARQPTYESGQLTLSGPPMDPDGDWLAYRAHTHSRPIFISLVRTRWRTRGDLVSGRHTTHDRRQCVLQRTSISASEESISLSKEDATRNANVCESERTFQINPAAASYDAGRVKTKRKQTEYTKCSEIGAKYFPSLSLERCEMSIQIFYALQEVCMSFSFEL